MFNMVLTQRQLNNFWAKVDKTNDCWNWKGYISNGYGKININYKVYLSHKISMVINGKLDQPSKKELGAKGVVVMHRCDNRRCVNPSHLIVATQKENMADAMKKGRKWNGELAGEKNPHSKLTWKNVNKIKSLFGKFTQSAIARMFGVDKSQISCIKLGKTWRTNFAI